MACGATLSLKRSLEFDPVHSPGHGHSPKRRRCMPITMAQASPPAKMVQPSPFTDATPKLSSEQIAAQISAEIKRMQRRKQLQYPGQVLSPSGSQSPPPQCSTSTQDATSDCRASSPSAFFNALSPSKKDIPLFTFKQVSLVCERMMREREEHIRQQYDQVLSCKLAEQYEAFLKFNHDQLSRRFKEAAASYVS